MRSAEDEGHLQVLAAVSLLKVSRLIDWNAKECEFLAPTDEEFEEIWSVEVDPIFGRLICWINFSAGAELLAKGLCLVHGIEIRHRCIDVPTYPAGDLSAWASAYRKSFACIGTTPTYDFGQLWAMLPDQKRKSPAYLLQLCKKMDTGVEKEDMLLAAYDLLRRAIRNRDAHAYVPNVRRSHQILVPELFAGCFNLLASWLPGGARTLNDWRAEAQDFVTSMS